MPGGSSAGAGVAVADGIGDIAIGTDTGGSVRIPAGFCGVVGFKPTVKRVSREGAFPLSFTLDSIGPLAKSVAECAATDAVIADETPAPLAAREIGSIRAGFVQGLPIEGLDEIVGKTYPQALAKLSSQWKSGKDVTLGALSKMHAVNERGGIAPPEAFAIHRELLEGSGRGRRSATCAHGCCARKMPAQRITSSTCATAPSPLRRWTRCSMRSMCW